MPSPNHYEVMGLSPSASHEEVERRFAELAKLYQLDAANPTDGEGMGALIAEAHRVLSNPALRAAYDTSLVPAPSPSPVPAPILGSCGAPASLGRSTAVPS